MSDAGTWPHGLPPRKRSRLGQGSVLLCPQRCTGPSRPRTDGQLLPQPQGATCFSQGRCAVTCAEQGRLRPTFGRHRPSAPPGPLDSLTAPPPRSPAPDSGSHRRMLRSCTERPQGLGPVGPALSSQGSETAVVTPSSRAGRRRCPALCQAQGGQRAGTGERTASRGQEPIVRAPERLPPQAKPRDTRAAETTGHQLGSDHDPPVHRGGHLRLPAPLHACAQTRAHTHVPALQLEAADCLGGQKAPLS